MTRAIKNQLDNFDIDLLSCVERKEYLRCKEQMSKRASLLRLIDNSNNDLCEDLQLIADVILEENKSLD